MGAAAPTWVGHSLFQNVNSKTVTVKVPSGATGYGSSPTDATTNNWGNAFRGLGRNWQNSSITTFGVTVNTNINLIIAYQ
jgi:hypothetical protein